LAGTDLTTIKPHLASTIGGSAGDTQADTVIINGTNGEDVITETLTGGVLSVTGLAAQVAVDGFEPTLDTVRVQGVGGDDVIDASAVAAGGPLLVLDGGAGDDVLVGGAGNDTLLGGDNDDVLIGNGGVDSLDGGLGNNILIQDGGSNATSGIITLFGDSLDNTITISRDAAGALYSNGVAIPGATVANTSLIRVFGLDGSDVITINETNGALPEVMLFGGAGNDTLTGGSGDDYLFGGIGNDTILGKGGFDLLFGGANNDTLTGGDADDQVFGEGDNDRMIWNPR
jgi:Ca2+-binding RTX toxin-like protein